MRSVTVATLIYRSPTWLRFVLEQLALAKNDAKVHVLVVGNDANMATTECLQKCQIRNTTGSWTEPAPMDCGLYPASPVGEIRFQYLHHRNANPYEYYMARVYRAWNAAMRAAETEDVILINSDMSFADHWADELLAMRDEMPCIPTSLLIESGRYPSGLPDYVADYGKTPQTFDRASFIQRATDLRNGTGRRRAGGLFMPCLFRKEEFFRAGGYEEQKYDHVLASDAKLFQKMELEFKLPHVTAMRSVCYHVQRGEIEDDVA